MIEKELHSLGFSKNEIEVYLSLFDLGKVKAGEIIEKTGLHRNIVYTSLEEFLKRNLITKTIIKGVANFVVNSPDVLVEEIEQKKQLAQHIAQILKEKQLEGPREISILEGIESIKKVNDQSLNLPAGATTYVFGATKFSVQEDLNTYWEGYHKKRIKKGVAFKCLYDKHVDISILDSRNALDLCEVKYMPQDFSMPMWIYIMGDVCSIVTDKENPLVINIKSKEIAKAFTQYFDYLWNQEVVIETGLDALHRCFYNMLGELEEDDEYFVLGASLGNNSTEIKNFYDTFHTERIKKGVKNSMLIYKDSYDLIKKRFEMAGDPDFKISKLKKFSTILPIPMQINLYRGKTSFILYGDEPTIIYFDKKEIFDSFKGYFDYLWNQEVQTYSGWKEIHKLFNITIPSELEEGDTEYVIGAGYGEESSRDKVDTLFFEHNKLLVANGIYKHALFFEQHAPYFGSQVEEFGKNAKDLIKVKTLPETYSEPTEIHVYKHKVIITYFGENPVSTVYERPEIVAGFKKKFDFFWDQEVQTYSGWEEVEKFYYNVLLKENKEGNTSYVIGGGYGEGGTDKKVADFYNAYAQARADAKTQSRILFYEHHREEAVMEIQKNGDPDLSYNKLKFLPKQHYSPMQTFICGSLAAIVYWGEDPVVTFYRKSEMIDSFKKQFDLLWSIAKA
ncbi:MAG: hypothetical protein COU32_01105 [Candidatus Magasanikbacteria bacterium CG10_big_fil_rev_8_21_14_0_10_42_10]|uniref:Transcription regulator TrmB N-terminal domain-containing protein n=2 Tax=Candidatus Magasanikiibacteriota TaxID=1752731 RepID=A0A2H0TWS3_9BACT|nr:MAG: hypothetical protein COU32_01105 [Candidatus Magasanikbacteria bacterium CG10_big_fil_rev_8_21_14_0_10_42_10]PIZ93952.1 MAG: hypothetical protein COX82_01625 [Candidatus Magasanikbacteria bacterium CG_4_10_14_0_2_um_filter_41_10]